MFRNLIESGSHRDDLARRGSFFLGTFALYAVLLLAGGVVSVFAYDVHLQNQNLELITLVTPTQPMPDASRTAPRSASTANSGDRLNQPPIRTQAIASTNIPTSAPRETSSAPQNLPTLPNVPFVLGDHNADAGVPNAAESRNGAGTTGANTRRNGEGITISSANPPPPAPRVEAPPASRPAPRIVISNVLNGRATHKPAPPYPATARAARVMGVVSVQILVDESGRVIEAHVVSGHPLLRDAAQRAAYQARFTPTMLNGQPVRVSGAITYNFSLQ